MLYQVNIKKLWSVSMSEEATFEYPSVCLVGGGATRLQFAFMTDYKWTIAFSYSNLN